VELCKSDVENPSQPFALQLLSTDRHHEIMGERIAATNTFTVALQPQPEGVPTSQGAGGHGRGRKAAKKGGAGGGDDSGDEGGSGSDGGGASSDGGGSSDEENHGRRRQQQGKKAAAKKPAAKRARKAPAARARAAV
jgi:hypothetical protein